MEIPPILGLIALSQLCKIFLIDPQIANSQISRALYAIFFVRALTNSRYGFVRKNRKKVDKILNYTICLAFYWYFWDVECWTPVVAEESDWIAGWFPFKYTSTDSFKSCSHGTYLVPPTLQRHNTENCRNKYSQKRNCPSSVLISPFICLWVIYIFLKSVAYSAAEKYINMNRSWEYINRF
jgi:hypothetical protein